MIDPQCNVEVIVACLEADPVTHFEEAETERLECEGFGERVALRLGSVVAERDRSSFWISVGLPYFYAIDPLFRLALEPP